jgi:hypothetical protein
MLLTVNIDNVKQIQINILIVKYVYTYFKQNLTTLIEMKNKLNEVVNNCKDK